MSLSGSAHSRSHSRPVSGTSVGRGMRFICSSDFNSGDSPPCMHRICVPSIIKAGLELDLGQKLIGSSIDKMNLVAKHLVEKSRAVLTLLSGVAL